MVPIYYPNPVFSIPTKAGKLFMPVSVLSGIIGRRTLIRQLCNTCCTIRRYFVGITFGDWNNKIGVTQLT